MADREALRELDVPPSESGAPLPHLIADELDLVFAYVVQQEWPGPEGRATRPRMISPDQTERCAIVATDTCLAVKFGPPNDEAVHGHRLAPLGLGPYRAYEVLHSAWIAEIEAANRVHDRHSPDLFEGYRHFIFTFHDSTLELVARDLEIEVEDGPIRLLLAEAFAACSVR